MQRQSDGDDGDAASDVVAVELEETDRLRLENAILRVQLAESALAKRKAELLQLQREVVRRLGASGRWSVDVGRGIAVRRDEPPVQQPPKPSSGQGDNQQP